MLSEPQATGPAPNAGRATMSRPHARSCVLIVDDSPTDRFLYERLITAGHQDFEVLQAESGQRGLAMAEEHRPSCILLDYKMPDLSGTQFLREIERRQLKAAVVMLTGASGAEVAVEAFKSGATDYLIKGRVTVTELQSAIRKAIERHQLRQKLADGGEPGSPPALAAAEALPAFEHASDGEGTPGAFPPSPGDLARALFERTDDLLLVFQLPEGTLVEAGLGGLAQFGYEKPTLIGRPASELGLFGADYDWSAFLRRAKGSSRAFEWQVVRANGLRVPVEIRAKQIAIGGRLHLAAMARDITEHKRQEAHLRELSLVDALTGMQNRRAFDSRLLSEWARAALAHIPVALLMIDVDHFKSYNDSLGHLRGDQCLRTLAHTLQGCLRRRTDSVARYGGEEFAILLPDTDLESAVQVGQRMMEAVRDLRRPHPASPTAAVLTISVGCAACVPDIEAAPIQLVGDADRALYHAKALGRSRVVRADQVPRPAASAAVEPAAT